MEVRLARQEILARDERPRLWAVIDEAVIHRVVGSVSVMRVYLEERSDVNRYTLAFDRLLTAALHPDDSVQLIERLASTLR